LNAIFTKQQDISKIWSSGKVWGRTEGSVYGMSIPDAHWMRTMINPAKRDPGTIVFFGEAADLFNPHEAIGPFSGLKRILGQHKAKFGDIVFDDAVVFGNNIFVDKAHVAPHVRSHLLAYSKLWTRRSFDIGTDTAIVLGIVVRSNAGTYNTGEQ
jgi:hypothetical protein